MKDLDAVAFLKDTSQAISFIQKSQRPRTPKEGKSVGYVLCFNSFEGLEAYKNYVVAETQTNSDEADRARKFKDKFDEFKNSNVIELYLDLKKVDDYEDLIDIENTYIPGKYPLFEDFDFSLFDDDELVFLTSVEKLKESYTAKKYDNLRNDPSFQQAATPQQLAKALRSNGFDKEADKIDSEVVELSTTDKRQLLEYYFVSTIRTFYATWKKTRETVLETNTYSDLEWLTIECQFGSKRVWEHVIETYPRYVSMIYNFLDKGFDL